jgi:hypothetical protein
MSERNKITDMGENINNPIHLQPRNLGQDAPRPTLSKRRGGKSQEEGEAVHGWKLAGDRLGIKGCKMSDARIRAPTPTDIWHLTPDL